AALAGGAAAALAQGEAHITSAVAAFVGVPAGESTNPSATTTVNVTGPDGVRIDAHSLRLAKSKALGISGSFGLSATGLNPEATTAGSVSAYVGEDTFITAPKLSVTADLHGTDGGDPGLMANATAKAASLSGVASGTAIQSTADAGGTVQAYIGAAAGSSASTRRTDINVGGGSVVVAAGSHMKANAVADGAGASLGFVVNLLKPTAKVTGVTQAFVREGVDLDAGSLKVSAGEIGVDTVQYEAHTESLS